MNEDANTIATAHFPCSLCGKEAGVVQLLGNAAPAELRRTSFTGALTAAITDTDIPTLRRILAVRDACALHAFDLEYAPFYCPACNASYCGDHWETWDVFDEDDPSWHDSIRGRCPHGHERMLED